MKVFSPFIRILNKMRYSWKFAIIGSILIMPLIAVSLFYIGTINEETKSIEKRLQGAQHNTALKDVLQYMQQTRGLTVTLVTGDTSVENELKEVKEKVDEVFETLETSEQNENDTFQTNKKFNEIHDKWHEIENKTYPNTNAVLTDYNYLISEVLELMHNVANNSELLLAKSKESFNLVYNASIALPNLTEQMGQMRALGVSMINSKEVTTAQLEKMNSIYFPMQDAIEETQGKVDLIFGNDEFSTALVSPLAAVQKTTKAYTAAITKMNNKSISSKEYYGLATTAINENFAFYTASMELLNNTLEIQLKDLKEMRILVFVTLVAITLLAIFLFISLYLAMKQSVQSLARGTKAVASGNLEVRLSLHTKDEMKAVQDSFNEMTSQLNNLVREISISAEHVASSSEELFASSEEATSSVEHVTTSVNDLANENEVQVMHLNESAQAMNEMVSGIERIAQNSVEISNLTSETTVFANEGNETVEKALQQMDMIEKNVEQTNQKILDLHQKSDEIDSIVNVITGISEQTNLLALNAAIEAARAGEAGKGFAVVANEVKKLAEESRKSASKIAELIHTIQIDTNDSVNMMNLVSDTVQVGKSITEESAYKFGHILNSMQTLNPQMEDISATATEFSAQAEQVAREVRTLLEKAQIARETTEEIAASSEEQLSVMEEVSSSANALSQMAESLQQLVARFNVN